MEMPAQQPHEDERQSQLKLLIAKGKEQGYLTYGEVNDHLPSDIVDPEQIEDIVNMINDMGITVYEKAPDAESLLLSDSAVSSDDDAADEAAAEAEAPKAVTSEEAAQAEEPATASAEPSSGSVDEPSSSRRTSE